jgi:hypothetical protein
MTRIPVSEFRDPAQINVLSNLASTRQFRGVTGAITIGDVCQDANDPRKVIIDFTSVGLAVAALQVNILAIDGDTSPATSGLVAPIAQSDIRNYRFPITYSQGLTSGKIVADFGFAIPDFLEKSIIIFSVSALSSEGTVLFTAEYTWVKANLPQPVGLNYNNGLLQVMFQYAGEQNCACSIECVSPSGVTANINFCPNQVQTINLDTTLNGDPFDFSIIVRDGLGNSSNITTSALLNVVPQPPSLGITQKDRHNSPRGSILVNPLSINNNEIKYKYYQIVKYESTPNNYFIWKDWTDNSETLLFDEDLKINKTYGYAIRYKGEFNDISEFSSWAILNTAFVYEDFRQPDLEPVRAGFGEWVERFNHSGQDTDAFAAFPETDFTKIIGIDTLTQNYGTGKIWPTRFKAAHAAVIPKGKYRGHVVVWDTVILVGRDKIYPGEEIAFQPYAIINPSPASGEKRFLNFLAPIGIKEAGPEQPLAGSADTSGYPNLFCAGQTWTHNGDLILAGGAFIGTDGRTIAFNQYALNKTYIWNPAGTSTFFFNARETPVYGVLTGEHYNSGAGCWVEGPELDIARYYPTTTLSQKIGRIGTGCPVVYVFGGSTPGFTYGGPPSSYYYTGYNSYEALQITGSVEGRECGYNKDYYNGHVWGGPGRLGSDYYFEDSLYFYPRMYVLSKGGVFMSSMAAKSATLQDHDLNPGVWTYTEGHDYQEGRLNAFRDYNTAVFFSKSFDKTDYVVRLGGGSSILNAFITPENNITGWEHSNVEAIECTIEGTKWEKLPHLNRPRNLANSIALADGSIFTNGGGMIIYRRRANNALVPFAYGRPGAGTERVDPTALINPWHELHGHHNQADHPGYPGEMIDEYEAQIGNFLPESVLENSPTDLTIPEIQGQVFTSVGGSLILNLVFHTVPETIFPGQTQGIPQPWAPASTVRQYHSTTVLLPDGRVFTAGGEGRAERGGYDYEIYEPHYLKPITAYSGLVYPRPESVVITDATINSNPAHNAYDLDYGQEYTLECSTSILPESISRIALVSPCAATHHADMSQRYTDLTISQRISEVKVKFFAPDDDKIWQRGFHMLFALTNNNVPSHAIWVKF